MATLRNLIDGRVIDAAAPVPPKPKPNPMQQQPNGNPNQNGGNPNGKPSFGPGLDTAKPGSYPSPAGQHVAQNMQDPYGATKDELDELNQAKLNYEMKKAQMQMKLAPVQHVVDGIKQMHEMEDPTQMQNPADASMGYQDPNDPMSTMGNPPNMSQTPGAMNTGMPSGQPIGAPGVAPGMPKEAIRPFKLGQPSPGMARPGQMAGMPSAGPQFNPAAPKPAGAGQLPGAKGPGDPKVQNKVKKAQSGGKSGGSGASSSSGKVAIHVHADSVSSSPAKRTIMSYAGADALRSAGTHECDACGDKMKAYGTSEGVRKEWEVRRGGSTNPRVKERFPKYVDPTKNWKPNPNQQKRPNGPPVLTPEQQEAVRRRIANWGKKNFMAYGTSDGVRKAWESRGHGKREAIVDINDKRGFNAPIDRQSVSTKKQNWGDQDSDKTFEAAKLSMKKRKSLKKSQFVFPSKGPGHGSYPIPDAKHGRIAKALVKMHGNPSEIARVNKAVKTKYGFTAERATGGVVKAVAPPGREDQVKALKKKFGDKSAFKIAWSSYNRGK